MQITPDQIRAARALLRLNQAELAEQAHTTLSTPSSLEELDGALAGEASGLVDKARHALEGAGVEFIAGGVRRRPPVRPEAPARFERLTAISRAHDADRAGTQDILGDDLYDGNGLPA